MKVVSYYLLMLKRAKMIAQKIQGQKIDPDEIKKIEADMLLMFAPKKFLGEGGYEIEYTKSFEETCHNLSTQINRDPKRMTVLEYYQAIESIMDKNKNSGK